ncbi:uncharacterized protein LOC132740913 [Ruditapes philippinarum]|uniref:uncharacterized protein LOC132740913 n=1 Tax=Ruditapes philippinarum TaxID=129788 RepID=UPI00295B1F38|nr:uncharacterized protein LOC132740913 [Ruditapes philippinarum]
MASYSAKIVEKKYNNWVKAQLAVLFTKEGIEPFICNEIKQFQLKCLDDICYNNRLQSGTLCSSCCTENVVKCPTNKICNVGRGKCSYHRNAATKFNPAGCPNQICHDFKTKIQCAHRFYGPSYKNTDASQWCSSSWEVAKCFMPPDGYADKISFTETDFNGIISVIINFKDFQVRVHENLNNNTNIFEQAKVIGRHVRHSSKLEVEDTDLQKYFKVLQQLLSDPIHLATDVHAQSAKKKLTELANDTLIICKDDVKKALDDVAKAVQDNTKTAINEEYEKIKLDMIKRRQEDLLSLESKTSEGVTQIEYSVKTIKSVTESGLQTIENERNNTITVLNEKKKDIEGAVEIHTKKMKEEWDKKVDVIKGQGNEERTALINLGQTLQKSLVSMSTNENEEQYIDAKRKLKDDLILWYNTNQSTVSLSPVTDDFITQLAGFYVMPEIEIQKIVVGGKKETTRVESLHDLFTSERKVPKEIYLSATAGFGKTAFAKYLTITWCQANKKDENYSCFKEEELKALSGFDFLFLVLLRDSVKVCHVDDMIEQQIIKNLPCSSSLPKDFLKDLFRNEKCLVILDGLDEWTHPVNDCSRHPKAIPHRFARDKCIILTTTRPWKLADSNIKTSQIDRIVELVQLNIESALQFKLNAMHILKGSLEEDELKNQVCSFEEEISEHDLEDVESTPLLLLYLICLWVEDIPIGNSVVDLYASIIQLLLYRTEKIHGELHLSSKTYQSYIPKCFRKHNHCCKYYTLLMILGKLAFHTLISDNRESKLVFDKHVAKNYLKQEDLNFCLRSGIITESKVKTLVRESSKISFSHKTVQEFFLAMYVSFQNTSDVQKILKECTCIQNILDMSKVFIFISKMNPKLMSKISSVLMHVVDYDEKTGKYRTMTDYDYRYADELKDIQDMFMAAAKECQKNKDLKICLQDVFINEKCHDENYFCHLQHLILQNKENIKSINIENEGICSTRKLIKLFALSDLPKIEKIYYNGEIKEREMIRLLLKPLKCLTVMSCKWENNDFVEKRCPLSSDLNGHLIELQHLQCLHLSCFIMCHSEMAAMFDFLTDKISMMDIKLLSLYCSDHDTSCMGFNFDISGHSHLRCLGLHDIPVSQLNINVSLLEECTVGELFKPDVLKSYLRRLPAACKLQTLECGDLESSDDIETMLQTLPLLHHVKDLRLHGINLGERSIELSCQMSNIENVILWYMTMSCTALHDLITVVSDLPHSVTVEMRGCDITPETEFEKLKASAKDSDKIMVTIDDTIQSGEYVFEFKTNTNLK